MCPHEVATPLCKGDTAAACFVEGGLRKGEESFVLSCKRVQPLHASWPQRTV